jgi:hypothetical protein
VNGDPARLLVRISLYGQPWLWKQWRITRSARQTFYDLGPITVEVCRRRRR